MYDQKKLDGVIRSAKIATLKDDLDIIVKAINKAMALYGDAFINIPANVKLVEQGSKILNELKSLEKNQPAAIST